MAYRTDFRGGPSSNYFPFIDNDNIFVYDSISWPTGNANINGTGVVAINSVNPNGASGVTNATVTSDGLVRLYNGTGRLTFQRNPNSGGSIGASSGGGWTGAMCGYFTWSSVGSRPTGISTARTGRSVKVNIARSVSDGGSMITSYHVQYSANGGGWTGAQDASTGDTTTFNNLTAGVSYRFRVYANNANGPSLAMVSAAILVPAGGRRLTASGYTSTTIFKRLTPSGFVDVTIAKRLTAAGWVDLS